MWEEKSMIRKRSVRLGQCGSLVLGMTLLVVWPAWGAEPENEALVAGGKDLFLRRCASCHGESGKGNGPTASVLKNPPADLTTISLKHGGQFPRAEMIRFIDGERPVPAHGPRHMPVWGEVFREEKSDSEARMRLHSLVAFLESLQQK
jgi:mono/diheme cytochrome c family protein